jgi:hypothetical protein
MSSWIRIFSCCERVNYVKNKEIDINSFSQKDDVENEEDENQKEINNKKKVKNNKIGEENLLINQSNSELYNNFIKNNISSDKQNITLNNLNLDKSQKIINGEDFNNYSNKVINNNIINNNIIKITNNNNFLNMNQKDIGYISFCGQSNINKSHISSKASNLQLSGNLFFNQHLTISQNGFENSLRNKNEFPIYFGTEAIVGKNGVPFNDYIVNLNQKKKIKQKLENNINNDNENNDNNNEKEIKENENIKGGRLFQILYDKNKNEYILNFIHKSLILYYRINNNPVYLDYDKEYYLILGNVFLSILIKIINEKKNICVKVETEDQKAEKANFEDEKKLLIGRGNTCDIEIDKQCISKIHSSIEYDKDINQYYYKDNNSTNGSTLLIREDDSIKLKGSMFFKLEDTSFIIKEVK